VPSTSSRAQISHRSPDRNETSVPLNGPFRSATKRTAICSSSDVLPFTGSVTTADTDFFQVESDRVRLSAELDELLRTRLSELTQLAEAGVRDDQDAGPAFARIEAESRATLEQMRSVVGLLRDGDAAATEPQPTLAHLDALLLHEKGTEARLTVTGEPRVLPAGLELSAYRVVEHLLGATGDAPGVQVNVDFRADALEVTVSGPVRSSRRRTEAALDRARERLALHHGSLESEIAGGRTRATAALPVLVTA
jgi:hypothetical protein